LAARLLDDRSVSATSRTRLRQRKQALALGDDASTLALGTDDRHRPRLRAGSAALAACGRHLDRDLRLEPAQRILEGHVDGHVDVGAALGLTPLRARAAAVEEVPEDVAESPEVVDGEVAAAAEVTRIEARAAVRGAERVVLLALLRVGEDVVRVLHFLELLLGGRVTRVLVRVVLGRELPVGLLDLVFGRALLHAQRVVQRRHYASGAAATTTRAGRRTRSPSL